jgi:hypothetical protein
VPPAIFWIAGGTLNAISLIGVMSRGY